MIIVISTITSTSIVNLIITLITIVNLIITFTSIVNLIVLINRNEFQKNFFIVVFLGDKLKAPHRPRGKMDYLLTIFGGT